MAKVGILTFHCANNYGAVLQAYGLSKAVEAMGHSVEVLDYRPLPARRAYGRWTRNPLKLLPSAVTRHRFHQFRQKYLPLSSRAYLTIDDLRRYTTEVDYVICGSDQVWNITLYAGYDPAFFLDFRERSVPQRISYAASFGDAHDFGDHQQQIRDLLSRFDRLSVRDLKSQDILRELTGRTAPHVLDPSFLTDYGPITPQRIFKHPYILAYFYGTSDFGIGVVRTLRERLGMPVVSVHSSLDGAMMLRSAGPLQWLSLMHHAEFVCTNSFHGTCFSLINKREFVTLPIARGQSRLEDILQTVGLKDRLVRSEQGLEECLKSHIYWSAVLARLGEARLSSQTFLRDSLNGCGRECSTVR